MHVHIFTHAYIHTYTQAEVALDEYFGVMADSPCTYIYSHTHAYIHTGGGRSG